MKYAKAVSTLLVALMLLSFAAVFPIKVKALGQATIFINPPLYGFTKPPYGIGSTFTLHVDIKDYSEVAGWQVKLVYDKTLLTATAAVYSAGDFIFPAGSYPSIPAGYGSINGTHDYVLMTTTTYGAVEYSGSLAGLMDVTFQIIAEPASPGGVVSCPITFWTPDPPNSGGDTWTLDEDLNNNDLTVQTGTYRLEWIKAKPYLGMNPVTVTKPTIPGDLVIGEHFFWDIYAYDVSDSDQIILVQYQITWDPTWIDLVWLWEGDFMGNPTWAPYGTFNNITIFDTGSAASFILILPNPGTGEWDWGVFPSGSGKVATAEFVILDQPPDPVDPTFPVTLPGVFGEYFVDTNAEYVEAGPAVDGTFVLNGFAWHAPVAQFSFNPTMPLVDETVTFDGSTSYDLDPWDHIVSYEWDFGDGSPLEYGAIVTHAYTEMGDYTVKLTVTDTMGKTGEKTAVVTVIFGRMIDVYVCYPDPYGGQGINKTADMYWPQKTVVVKVNVTYNGNPVQFKPVAFQIKSPNGVYDFTETAITDENGFCWIDFGLPWPCGDWNDTFGIWTIIAKVDIRCVVVQDWLWFKHWWLAEIIEVTPKESEYHYCQDAEFFIKIRSYARQPRPMLITLSVFDDLDVCIGTDYTWITVGEEHPWCTWVYYNTTLTIHIPKWAFVGKGTAKVNIFWPDWPEFCGSAMCPQGVATFKITLP